MLKRNLNFLEEVDLPDAALRRGLVFTKSAKLGKLARRCGVCGSPLANMNKSDHCFNCQEGAQTAVLQREMAEPVIDLASRKKGLHKRIKKEAASFLKKRKRRGSRL